MFSSYFSTADASQHVASFSSIYIYIYVYICVCMCTCILYMYNMHMYKYIYIYKDVHICMRVYIHMFIYKVNNYLGFFAVFLAYK